MFALLRNAAGRLLSSFPEFSFSVSGQIDEIPNAVRVRWSLGSRSGPPAFTGLDVIVIAERRIVSVYRFLDGTNL